MIQIYSNSLGKKELKSLKKVFKSKWLGKGPKTQEFIEKFSQKIETNFKNLSTISCCTEGIFQILEYLNLKKGDEVILPSISFVGVANAIVSVGAKPVFCDVDKFTLNPTKHHIKEKLTPKTKAVIVLHYAGVPCDIENIAELCKDYSITLIEDNANSPFSKLKNKSTGLYGDYSVWSFDAMKILVTGDGGMIYCKNLNDNSLIQKRSYMGLESSSGLSNSIDQKWWEFEISSAGRRSITNDIQASIGIEQLKKVDKFISKRKKIHDLYTKELKNIKGIKLPIIPKDVISSYYMYHIQVENRDKFAKYLRENKIYTTFRYYPLHWVNFYKSKEILPNTEYAANRTLCLPLHQNLSKKNINHIIKTIKLWKH
jgi:dTDP-4-amino-4,6-dideoxygalactose transaminase